MAMFMNRNEVVETLAYCGDQVEDVPNLYEGARVLYSLMEWVDSHSDGWPYWQPPQRAASRLIEALHSRNFALRFGEERDGSPLADVTDAELAACLRPIKSFLTKQEVNWHADLPWAALFPAA
jgi:hypothetical protein